MVQKKFMDIERAKFGDDLSASNIGCFESGDIIQISEKWDGSNAACRYDVETGKLVAFSRKQTLDYNNTLNGFWNYIQSLDAQLFSDTPNYVVFGEWGNKNKIIYRQECYKKWYVYDIYDVEKEQYLTQDIVKQFAESHGLEYIHVLYEGEFVSWDHCKTFMNSPAYGDSQEGIVCKNQTKLNSPNTRQPFYLKLVNESFSEVMKNRVKLIDPEKEPEKTKAQEIVNTIVTKRRVEKELYKMRNEGVIPEKLQPSDMKLVAQSLPKRIYEDCLKEEKDLVISAGEWFGKLSSGQVMKFAREIILGQ